jgi:hypothetical protein
MKRMEKELRAAALAACLAGALLAPGCAGRPRPGTAAAPALADIPAPAQAAASPLATAPPAARDALELGLRQIAADAPATGIEPPPAGSPPAGGRP